MMSHNSTTHLIENFPWICSHPIKFVNKCKSRNLISSHLPINSNRLTLHTANTTKYKNGTIKNTQSPLNLDREIYVTGGVNNVNLQEKVFQIVLEIQQSGQQFFSQTMYTFKFTTIKLLAIGHSKPKHLNFWLNCKFGHQFINL